MGFTNWGKTAEQAADDERRHAEEMRAIQRAGDEAVRNIRAEMVENRRRHGEYRNWLYHTKAWNVSFDDWLAGRYVVVSVS